MIPVLIVKSLNAVIAGQLIDGKSPGAKPLCSTSFHEVFIRKLQ